MSSARKETFLFRSFVNHISPPFIQSGAFFLPPLLTTQFSWQTPQKSPYFSPFPLLSGKFSINWKSLPNETSLPLLQSSGPGGQPSRGRGHHPTTIFFTPVLSGSQGRSPLLSFFSEKEGADSWPKLDKRNVEAFFPVQVTQAGLAGSRHI